MLPTSAGSRYFVNLRIGKACSEQKWIGRADFMTIIVKMPKVVVSHEAEVSFSFFLILQSWWHSMTIGEDLDDIQWHLVTSVHCVHAYMWKMCTCMNESKTQALSFVEASWFYWRRFPAGFFLHLRLIWETSCFMLFLLPVQCSGQATEVLFDKILTLCFKKIQLLVIIYKR